MAKSILLADDEHDIVTILKRALEVDGYTVTVVNDGQEALNAILSKAFDLMILDVMMPKVTGWDVCKKVKSDPRTQDTPVIILTAKSQESDALMSCEAGADEYVTKPFDYEEISGIIKGLLGPKQ